MLKRLQIAQAEGKDWRRELRRYLLQYRALPHGTTGRSPAELLYNRQISTKMPGTATSSQPLDQEVRDRDSESKTLSKNYTDQRRGARYSEVEVGDRVLIQQDRQDKLKTAYRPTPCDVVAKSGNSLTVQSPDGAEYNRNTTHVRKYMETNAEPINRKETVTEPEHMHGPVSPNNDPRNTGEDNDPGGTGDVPHLRRSQRTITRPKKYDDYV